MKQLSTIDSKLNREVAKAQGYYDGRFRTRSVKDVKKELDKRWCRSTNTNTYGYSSMVE